MKESYREGVANHSGSEPCEGGREAALEALDRGICGLGIELRNLRIRERTASCSPERNNARCDSASASRPLRSRRPHARIETPRARTERDSVGINRRGAVMAEIIRVRNSEPAWPRAMRGRS